MTIKVGDNEYYFDGYTQPLQSIQQLADECYQQGRAEVIEEFITYLKSVIPCEMPKDMCDIGVDNTCDRILKEQNNE